MAQIAYRANLSAAIYPMTIADSGRTVIIPGPDQNFDRRVDPTGEQKDAGIPQALYMENVIPTSNGYQSVGFMTATSPMTIPPGASYIQRMTEIKATITFVGPSFVPFSIIKLPLFHWDNGVFTAGVFGTGVVTFVGTALNSATEFSTAVVRGVAYLFMRTDGASEIYEVSSPGGLAGSVTLTNVSASATPVGFFGSGTINSICASNNYLIAQTTDTIFWSSTTTPLDFDASLVSGAGQIQPNNADDAILCVKESSGGFYLYAKNNCLYSQYTGNSRYPWKFSIVKGSSGIYSTHMWNSYGTVESPGQYVIEKHKNLKFFQGAEAVPAAVESSDFLSKSTVQELFNFSTNIFTAQVKLTDVPTIYAFLGRYLILSINGTNDTGSATENYTHALVLDTVLNRYGKLRIDHTFIFTVQGTKETLAFVNKQTNTIRYMNFDIYQVDIPFAGVSFQPHTGVLVLGKFQYVRSRKIQLHEIQVEGPQNTAIIPSPNFSCVLLPSKDGRTFDSPIPLTARSISGGLAVYPVHTTAQNHSIVFKGAFNINTVQLHFSARGDR